MPLFYQQDINETTKLGIWNIKESEAFFLSAVPLQREITHPHKRLQHLAGRFLLRQLFPDFPYDLIRIADTRKPFLQNEAYHFSISHCGDFAAAIVSSTHRVGIDVENSTPKMDRIRDKFLNPSEKILIDNTIDLLSPDHPFNFDQWLLLTLFWSAKESVFKWYGDGGIDFSEQIIFTGIDSLNPGTIQCRFSKKNQVFLNVDYRIFNNLSMSFLVHNYTE